MGARSNQLFFQIVVNDFDAKKSARYNQMLPITKFVVSGNQCNVFNLHVHLLLLFNLERTNSKFV